MRVAFSRLPHLLLCLLLLPFLFTTGCTSLGGTRERPEALEPVPVEASPGRAFDAALTVAFERGYNIAYTDEDTHLIELDALDRRFLFPNRVRRIDFFVRERQGQTYIHPRVHSFESGDPSDIDVTDDDRAATRRLLDAITDYLEEQPHDNPYD